MPERDGKDQGDDSPKQACSGWYARHSLLATSGANWCPRSVWFADVKFSFSGVTFVLFFIFFRFRFGLYALIEAATIRSFVLRYERAPTVTHSHLTIFNRSPPVGHF